MKKPLVKKISSRQMMMNKKVQKVMHEFGMGKLHMGSKKGKIVKNPKQALAISLSVARKAMKK